MARIVVTGSADGLGRATTATLLADGHDVIVHARSAQRLAAVRDLLDQGAKGVTGDLAEEDATRGIAEQINRLGPVDAVVHNAGIIGGPDVMAVNVVAPYLLTAGGDAGRAVPGAVARRPCRPDRYAAALNESPGAVADGSRKVGQAGPG